MDPIMAFMKKEQKDKLDRYRILNETARKGQILFTGSSLMEQFPIHELLMDEEMDCLIYNRGIGGFTTEDMLENMQEQVYGTEPSKIFINIGTNDMGKPDYKLEKLMDNYKKILEQIKEHLPETEIYMMAYYPVNEVDKKAVLPDEEWANHMFDDRNNSNIRLANQAVKQLAEKMGCRYIDANEGLYDESGRLKKEFTLEGVHMYANGYRVVLSNLKKYL